jgi:hypothetical protein
MSQGVESTLLLTDRAHPRPCRWAPKIAPTRSLPRSRRRAGVSAAEGVGARELRVCVTHLLVRMVMVLPAERRGAEPRAGGVALANFLGAEVRQYLCSDFRTEKNKSHIHFYSKVKPEKPLAARASATARRAPHGVPPPRKVSLLFLGARVVASSAA